MSKKEKKPEDVTPEEQTEQAVPTLSLIHI